MALNLKIEDRAVPNCSSDESGSDCSSEELIDCDVIVDVTTVTRTDEETTQNSKQHGKNVKGNFNENIKHDDAEKMTVVTQSNKSINAIFSNMKGNTTNDKKSNQEGGNSDDKSSTIISLNPIGRHANHGKNLGSNHKKRRVNFNLTIDIAKQPSNCDRESGEQCVPQSSYGCGGGPGSTDFTDIESLSEPVPTTPGGKPQVHYVYFIVVYYENYSRLKLNQINQLFYKARSSFM